MTALAAARFGYRCHIFTPEPNAPASQVSAASTIAEWTDEAALARFAAACDVVTYEFENIPAKAASLVARQTLLRPSAKVLATCQDRIMEKTFLETIGVPLARWRSVGSAADLERAIGAVGMPAVLKSARLGYDGKGQAAIDPSTDLAAAWAELIEGNATDEAAGVVEAWVAFTLEISVIVARSTCGDMATWVPVENRHENHILRRTIAPAPIQAPVAERAGVIARRVAEELALEGVMAVEMFVLGDGDLLVNELAPRPHNSGHYTIEACVTSQFENHLRAVLGLPLGDTRMIAPAAVMVNVLGRRDGAADVDGIRDALTVAGAHLHLSGKRDSRVGRKMGHVTALADSLDAAEAIARAAEARIRL